MKNNTVKIAVALHGNQFRAVQAQLVPDLGPTPVALHRSINHSGWSLTSVHCGFVICRGATKAKAVGYDVVFDRSGVGAGGVPFILHSKEGALEDFTNEVIVELNKNAPA